MISLNRRWLGGFAVAVTLFPGGVRAQTAARSFDELQGILKADEIVVVIDNAGNETARKFAERLYVSSATERSCLTLLFASLTTASKHWRGIPMTPAILRHVQDLRNETEASAANEAVA